MRQRKPDKAYVVIVREADGAVSVPIRVTPGSVPTVGDLFRLASRVRRVARAGRRGKVSDKLARAVRASIDATSGVSGDKCNGK